MQIPWSPLRLNQGTYLKLLNATYIAIPIMRKGTGIFLTYRGHWALLLGAIKALNAVESFEAWGLGYIGVMLGEWKIKWKLNRSFCSKDS